MTDVFTKAKRSQIMAKVLSKNTIPEKAVRSLIHRLGLRFRIHSKKLPGKPDIVLKKYMTVIEVQGCFWHRHSKCKQSVIPKSNVLFWTNKFHANVIRSKRNRKALRRLGWKTIIIWECEIKQPTKLENRIRKYFRLNNSMTS